VRIGGIICKAIHIFSDAEVASANFRAAFIDLSFDIMNNRCMSASASLRPIERGRMGGETLFACNH
jgi:hypothetical protein